MKKSTRYTNPLLESRLYRGGIYVPARKQLLFEFSGFTLPCLCSVLVWLV